jgi:thiamine phosphate synthase YjbQ (UPF0047 family)
MAAMASAVSGMSAVCHKEGTGPCKCYATYFVAHITASVFINDDERGLHTDYEDWLEELAPYEPTSRYRHNRTGEARPEAPPSVSKGGVEGATPMPI